MNLFDKICAVVAALLGVALVVLGVFGVALGCRFWFTLPPVLGGLPALAGWGILRSVWFGWKYRPAAQAESAGPDDSTAPLGQRPNSAPEFRP